MALNRKIAAALSALNRKSNGVNGSELEISGVNGVEPEKSGLNSVEPEKYRR